MFELRQMTGSQRRRQDGRPMSAKLRRSGHYQDGEMGYRPQSAQTKTERRIKRPQSARGEKVVLKRPHSAHVSSSGKGNSVFDRLRRPQSARIRPRTSLGNIHSQDGVSGDRLFTPRRRDSTMDGYQRLIRQNQVNVDVEPDHGIRLKEKKFRSKALSIEMKLTEELKVLDDISATDKQFYREDYFRVYSKAFDNVIHNLPEYAPLLRKLKLAYESKISNLTKASLSKRSRSTSHSSENSSPLKEKSIVNDENISRTPSIFDSFNPDIGEDVTAEELAKLRQENQSQATEIMNLKRMLQQKHQESYLYKRKWNEVNESQEHLIKQINAIEMDVEEDVLGIPKKGTDIDHLLWNPRLDKAIDKDVINEITTMNRKEGIEIRKELDNIHQKEKELMERLKIIQDENSDSVQKESVLSESSSSSDDEAENESLSIRERMLKQFRKSRSMDRFKDIF